MSDITRIGADELSCPIVQRYRPKDKIEPPPLLLYPTHGFANRLRFIACATVWLRKIESEFKSDVRIPIWIIWENTVECNINVDNFLRKSDGHDGIWFLDAKRDVEKVMTALRRATKQVSPYFSNNPTFIPSYKSLRGSLEIDKSFHANRLDMPLVRKWVRLGTCPKTDTRPIDLSYAALTGGHIFGQQLFSGSAKLEEMRSSFYLRRIVPFLKRWAYKPNSIRPTFVDWSMDYTKRDPLIVGIHYRDYIAQFDAADHLKFTESSPLQSFENVIKRLHYPRHTYFLIVSNSIEGIKSIKNILRKRCNVPAANIRETKQEIQPPEAPKLDRSNRSSEQSMRQSIIDFFALAACDIVVSSWGSSFSTESSIVGMRPQIHPVSVNQWDKIESSNQSWIGKTPIKHVSRRMVLVRSNIPLLCSTFLI